MYTHSLSDFVKTGQRDDDAIFCSVFPFNICMNEEVFFADEKLVFLDPSISCYVSTQAKHY